MARKLGIDGILARTEDPPAENGELGDDHQDDGVTNGRSRGRLRAVRPRKVRGIPPGEKPRGCKFTLPESVFDRLQQTAIKRRKTMSEVVAETLNSRLPYFDVTQRDRPPGDPD
jgi:hypothetical protein